MIELNDGNTVPIASILHAMARQNVTAMPISQQHVGVFDHTELDSLDFLLRSFGDNMDTAQATELVVDQLYTSGYFEPCRVQSRVSGRVVNGIQITI